MTDTHEKPPSTTESATGPALYVRSPGPNETFRRSRRRSTIELSTNAIQYSPYEDAGRAAEAFLLDRLASLVRETRCDK
jgi:hypothetical protein